MLKAILCNCCYPLNVATYKTITYGYILTQLIHPVHTGSLTMTYGDGIMTLL